MKTYRYPGEHIILILTLTLVIGIIAISALATLCGSVLFVLVMLLAAYILNRRHHEALMESARKVRTQSEPEVARLVGECAIRLQPGTIQTYIAPGNVLNAYTFGLVSPQVLVVYAGIFRIMDEDELRFIIGHEMGHVCLGHSRLNSLVGGMAGIPSPFLAAVVLYVSFRWWNRACEYSADRAGLLACGKPEKAASALIKLTGGALAMRSRQDWQRALTRIEAEDDRLEDNLRSMLSTHPMTVKRLDALQKFAATDEYRRLQVEVNRRYSLS
jgi:Zn-dependent protease with chaperone function